MYKFSFSTVIKKKQRQTINSLSTEGLVTRWRKPRPTSAVMSMWRLCTRKFLLRRLPHERRQHITKVAQEIRNWRTDPEILYTHNVSRRNAFGWQKLIRNNDFNDRKYYSMPSTKSFFSSFRLCEFWKRRKKNIAKKQKAIKKRDSEKGDSFGYRRLICARTRNNAKTSNLMKIFLLFSPTSFRSIFLTRTIRSSVCKRQSPAEWNI